ncbi:hypothetical protein E2562_007314 [Oryza meyeriana var. granulata]|uniref:Uncharacterized protein n=1 Tax=Oryza meyeriana var. granulata TaxID=110450 RepID=A0A6G1CZE2_9ORYZ|nr:hypothetical protein E2562_007314 [Oryza meyeriana var. granulata]
MVDIGRAAGIGGVAEQSSMLQLAAIAAPWPLVPVAGALNVAVMGSAMGMGVTDNTMCVGVVNSQAAVSSWGNYIEHLVHE